MAPATRATPRFAMPSPGATMLTPEQVVAADGTSMANFLAMAALIAPGRRDPHRNADLRAATRRRELPRRRNQAVRTRRRTRLQHRPRQGGGRDQRAHAPHRHHQSPQPEQRADRGGRPPRIRRARPQVECPHPHRRSLSRLRRAAAAQRCPLRPRVRLHQQPDQGLWPQRPRCGWILAEPELAERMWRLNDLFGVNQAHPAERLACIALDRLDEVLGDTPAMLERNRDAVQPFAPLATTSPACPPSTASSPFRAGPEATRPRSMPCFASVRHRRRPRASGLKCPTISASASGCPTDLLSEGIDRLGAALDELR